MPKKFKSSLSEIAAEVRRESGLAPQVIVRPGTYNLNGDLFDPSGILLRPFKTNISPSRAVAYVRNGADLAFEGCGCGGYVGGCDITWFTSDEASAGTAKFVKGAGSPTWIDVVKGDDKVVVFVHGDVEWGSLF
jgi:hypothetical protein